MGGYCYKNLNLVANETSFSVAYFEENKFAVLEEQYEKTIRKLNEEIRKNYENQKKTKRT